MNETMIERVARAMFEAGWPSEESRALAVKNNPNVIDGYRKLARAAIEAMQKPTEEMVLAKMLVGLFSAMISAALPGQEQDEPPMAEDRGAHT